MNSSGPISLAGTTAGVSIEIENGGNGTTQISLNDTAVRSLAGVPGSGTTIIMPTNFYGKSNQFSFTISSNTTNVNLRSEAITAGWNQSSALVATINAGVYVYSTSTGSYAMTISGSFPGGLSLVNNGTILGRGGDGAPNDNNGGSGGPALLVQSAVSITNASGNISGGGGGGGGGASYTYCASAYKGGCNYYETIAGGAGGGGIGNGAAGSGAPPCGYGATAGTLTTAGSNGGPSGCGYYYYVGYGGAGGGYGASGGAGSGPGNCCIGSYGQGGAGGAAVVGNSNITWVSTGTRNGSIS
jgi:hypothetical protein